MKPIKNCHTTLDDRISAAKRFISELHYRGEVVCDTMANEVLLRYETFPERILVIHNGIIIHEGAYEGGKPDEHYKYNNIYDKIKRCDRKT